MVVSVGVRMVAVVELGLEEGLSGARKRLDGDIEFPKDLVCMENSEKVRATTRSGLSERESEDDFKFFC